MREGPRRNAESWVYARKSTWVNGDSESLGAFVIVSAGFWTFHAPKDAQMPFARRA